MTSEKKAGALQEQPSLTNLRQRQQCEQGRKKKASRLRLSQPPPSHHATISLFTICILTLTRNELLGHPFSLFTQAQQIDSASSSNNNTIDNPENKFCGISYTEAQQYCHLPPHQSLPCPNGAEIDCPYNLQCWTIKETCTPPPTSNPTFQPSFSPITSKSSDPSDHYYCGMGFDNLFNCAKHCPGGSQDECPDNQICYFDTPCDARVQTRNPTSLITSTITTTGTRADDHGGGSNSSSTITAMEVLSPENGSSVEVLSPEGSNSGADDDGDHNFCGSTITEAMETCSREKHCPSGLNTECPVGMFCWSHLTNCDIKGMPTFQPTISSKPTPPPTVGPTTRSPSATESPTLPPINPADDHFYCGVTWNDASARCHMRCSEFSSNCPDGEECFNNVPCSMGGSSTEKKPSPSPTGAPFSGTRAPTFSPRPTTPPVESEESIPPTPSPLAKDDMRNFFFCGTSWMDASRRCYKRCLSGHHIECPDGEQCFAQADCRGLITPQPTTAAPFAGSRRPTSSPAPSMEPQPTNSPSPPSTKAPNNDPTESPTTPWPTFQPTLGPCQGEPCLNIEQCRSKTGFCGAGPAYCTNPSWIASCPAPTNPPVSTIPTDPRPTLPPTITSHPSSPSPPTISPSIHPSKSPMSISDFFDGITNSPTGPKSANAADSDEEYFAPDDPRGTYFCGLDWNHAITDCPTRCPNGELTECPSGWSCYAFTPCTTVGKPPTLKPTWEPTMKPIFTPTRIPSDSQQDTETTNSTGQQGWQKPPSLKPTYKPTGDRCRANPCEVANECRSKLGFCGVGIVYCNSDSSWEPECDPNYGANRGPSQAPSTLFDSWLHKQDNSTNSTSLKFDGVNEGKVTDETETDVPYTDYTAFNGGEDWDNSREKIEEPWWRVTSSASRMKSFFLVTLAFAAVLR